MPHRNELQGLVVENKSGRQAILGKVLVDATGDGDVSAIAGAPFEIGRPSDGKTRPMSLLFRVGGVNTERLQAYVRTHPDEFDPNTTSVDATFRSFRILGFFGLVEAARACGEIDPDCHWLRVEGLVEGLDERRGMVLINSTNVYSSGVNAAALTSAELAGRRQVHQLKTFLRKHVPGFESSYIVEAGTSIGVRETRRFLGDYVLTHEDVVEDRPFPDIFAVDWERHSRVVRGGGVDPHVVGGHSPDGQTSPRPIGVHRAEAAPLIAIGSRTAACSCATWKGCSWPGAASPRHTRRGASLGTRAAASPLARLLEPPRRSRVRWGHPASAGCPRTSTDIDSAGCRRGWDGHAGRAALQPREPLSGLCTFASTSGAGTREERCRVAEPAECLN